ncbi:MAG: nucleoside deaminase [Candidatus Limnocylindria bacterium]
MGSASPLDALEPPMRLAFAGAWEALRAGSVPVGAVVTDGAGSVISIGRARSMDRPAEPGRLSNTSIAHAEIDALARLPPGRHADHTVWTTLEPCLLCTGALVIATVGSVRFAAADPLWVGLDRLPEINAFVATRWPRRIGPRADELGAFAMLLPLLFYRQRYPDGASITIHRTATPRVAALADGLVDSEERRRWPAMDLEDVLDSLWSRLSSCLA